MPGLLKSLFYNKRFELPIKVFEIGDVVLKKERNDFNLKNDNTSIRNYYKNDIHINASNEKRLAFAFTNNSTAGLEIVHGTLDMLL